MALCLALDVPFRLGVHRKALHPEYITDNNCSNFRFYAKSKRSQLKRASQKTQQTIALNVTRLRKPKRNKSNQFVNFLEDHFQGDERTSVTSYLLQGEKMNIELRSVKQFETAVKKLLPDRLNHQTVICRYPLCLRLYSVIVNYETLIQLQVFLEKKHR